MQVSTVALHGCCTVWCATCNLRGKWEPCHSRPAAAPLEIPNGEGMNFLSEAPLSNPRVHSLPHTLSFGTDP